MKTIAIFAIAGIAILLLPDLVIAAALGARALYRRVKR